MLQSTLRGMSIALLVFTCFQTYAQNQPDHCRETEKVKSRKLLVVIDNPKTARNMALKAAVNKEWSATEVEFISPRKIEDYMRSDKYAFIVHSQTVREQEKALLDGRSDAERIDTIGFDLRLVLGHEYNGGTSALVAREALIFELPVTALEEGSKENRPLNSNHLYPLILRNFETRMQQCEDPDYVDYQYPDRRKARKAYNLEYFYEDPAENVQGKTVLIPEAYLSASFDRKKLANAWETNNAYNTKFEVASLARMDEVIKAKDEDYVIAWDVNEKPFSRLDEFVLEIKLASPVTGLDLGYIRVVDEKAQTVIKNRYIRGRIIYFGLIGLLAVVVVSSFG
ncbi:MAG: hypothetical protein RLP15_12980 [Cryomorphaceae bacterium]